MPKNNIIEINGKRYDAVSGQLLAGQSAARPAKAGHHKAIHPTMPAAQPVKIAVATTDVASKPTKHTPSRQPQASHTLMRQIVKKPAAKAPHRSKAQGHIQGHIETPARPAPSTELAKLSAKNLYSRRLLRARRIAKSQSVSHFLPVSALPDRPAPTPVAADSVKAAANRQPAHKPTAPKPAPAIGKQPRTTDELLDRAIQQATSHNQPAPARAKHGRKKRRLGLAASMALAVVLLGVITAQNLPEVNRQMVSAKAGFNVGLPDHLPSGFNLDQLDYSNGTAVLRFHSNNNDRRYTITEKRSSWDSDSLQRNFLAAVDPDYQAVAANGHTIYLYGEHNATWVNGGVWYIIRSNGALNDHQLAELASSL